VSTLRLKFELFYTIFSSQSRSNRY